MKDERRKELEKISEYLCADDHELRNTGLTIFNRTVLCKIEIQFIIETCTRINNEKRLH